MTNLEKDYENKLNSVMDDLQIIMDHCENEKSNMVDIDYSHIGEIDHVKEKLKEIRQFLGYVEV